MKIKNSLKLFVVVLMSFSTSCTKYDFEVEPEAENAPQFVIKPRVYISDPWSAMTRADIGETDPIFMCYLFDAEGEAINNKGDVVSSDMKVTFENITQTGNYSISCVTGWFKSEYPRTTKDTDLYKGPITLDTELFMCSPKDICLGSRPIYVNNSQYAYDVLIEVDHIMAKASFEITNVPDEIKTISITLPNQANKFKFNGDILGNTQSQTLSLSKASTPNDDGTFDWSIEETIVYPYAKETGDMPIHLAASNSTGSYTFNTESSTCCSKGRRVAYKADWNTMKYTQETQVKINPWTEEIINGSFDLGGSDNGK